MATEVYKIISDTTLTYHQQVKALAGLAESTDLESLPLTGEEKAAMKDGILCDLNEGRVPYRPRYIIPDYSILMEKGSKFLDLPAPTTLLEACTYLNIMYKHVPSITTFPVYLGNLDELLEPFVQKETYENAKAILKMFLLQIDRTLTDSFVHADIGPKDSLTARILLELSCEMQCAMPNLTLKYDPEVTSDDFAKVCAKAMLKVAKPSFANHKMFCEDWGEDYVIASCYNGLKLAGGGYTLPRLRMYELSLKANSVEDFKTRVLPHYVDIMLKFMDKRIKFIVEESSFFKSNFLVTEGFVKRENFTGMFGMVGLAECCNHLLGITDVTKGYGHNEQADQLGVEIMEELEKLVKAHEGKYCEGCGSRYGLHAQVGIDSDGRENSPGTRIAVGNEPIMPCHIAHSAKFHKFFPTGTGDIFKFEETWENTPDAVVDVIKGAMSMGMRYFSGYLENNDVVRVTGYLVKKSELAKLDANGQSLNNASIFGKGARDFSNALDRRVEKYEENSN